MILHVSNDKKWAYGSVETTATVAGNLVGYERRTPGNGH